MFVKTIRNNRTIAACASALVLIVLTAVLTPALSNNNGTETDFSNIRVPPTLSGGTLFGTDELGRDVFVRTMQGTRITIVVAIVASSVSLLVGVLYGAIAGLVGGRVDNIMMRMVDTLYALPFIFFVILLMVAFQQNYFLIFVAIGAVNWLDMARVVRGQTISVREREYVQSARLNGLSRSRLLSRHIIPNVAGIVIVYVTLTIPQAILVESFLSFLGLGIQEPKTSLGTLVHSGVKQMEISPWLLSIPACLLATILLSFNFLGDALRDKLDARG